jgi:S1-C subfamily serine protease
VGIGFAIPSKLVQAFVQDPTSTSSGESDQQQPDPYGGQQGEIDPQQLQEQLQQQLEQQQGGGQADPYGADPYGDQQQVDPYGSQGQDAPELVLPGGF